MNKLFLDANIIFAATYSSTGGSRAIFELAGHKKIKILSSTYAIKEAQTNILKKLGENHLPELFKLVSLLNEIDKKPAEHQKIQKFSRFIPEKDAPILISSIDMTVDFLITLDKKDFKTNKLKEANLPFQIMTPKEYLQIFLHQSK